MSEQGNSARRSRRTFLASLGAGATVALAGCTETLPPLGQRVRIGRIDFPHPEPEPPEYRSWLPAASALPERYEDSLVHAGRPANIHPSSFGEGIFVSSTDWLGTSFEEYDLAVHARGFSQNVYVFEGNTDPDIVADAVADTGFEPAGSYEGYDLYEREDVPRTVASTDGAVLWADEGGRAVIETFIDAHDGRVDRRHEVDEQFETMTDAVGLTEFDIVGGLHHQMDAIEDAAITGMSFAHHDDAMYIRSQALFEDEDEVPKRRVERELRATEMLVEADGVDVRTEGRRSVVEARFGGLVSDEVPRIPQITWSVSYDPDADTATIRHEAGDPVEADMLCVHTKRRNRLNTEADVQFADRYEQVEPGDTLDVSFDGQSSVYVHIEYDPSDNNVIPMLTYNPDL